MFSQLFTSRKIFVCLLAMGATALLGACGGGGGGDPYPNMNYTGVNTAAVIDQSNAADFPFVTLEGSSGSGEVFSNLPVGSSIDPEFAEGIPDPDNIKRAVDIISDLVKTQMSNDAQVVGASQSIVGNCAGAGGRATLSGNDSGSLITASLQMDNLCMYDSVSGITVKMHGLMNLSISYYGDYIFTDFTMSIRYLKMTVSDGVTTVSEEFAGTIEITDIDPGPPTFSVSVNFKYEGKIYKIVNLTVVEDMSVPPTTTSISGTLYHPVHGYVVITTTDPFVYNETTEQFCDGTLHIEGTDGGDPANLVEVDFTANVDCTQYDICVTINPNPQECVTGVNWDDAPAWPTAPAP